MACANQAVFFQTNSDQHLRPSFRPRKRLFRRRAWQMDEISCTEPSTKRSCVSDTDLLAGDELSNETEK
jgi:hypothetical protein